MQGSFLAGATTASHRVKVENEEVVIVVKHLQTICGCQPATVHKLSKAPIIHEL